MKNGIYTSSTTATPSASSSQSNSTGNVNTLWSNDSSDVHNQQSASSSPPKSTHHIPQIVRGNNGVTYSILPKNVKNYTTTDTNPATASNNNNLWNPMGMNPSQPTSSLASNPWSSSPSPVSLQQLSSNSMVNPFVVNGPFTVSPLLPSSHVPAATMMNGYSIPHPLMNGNPLPHVISSNQTSL